MYAARVDDSQRDIVNALRSVGASVEHLCKLGAGAPDLLVGFHGRNYLMEVKTPGSAHSKAKSGNSGKTAKRQKEWAESWAGGSVLLITTPTEALRAIGVATRVEHFG